MGELIVGVLVGPAVFGLIEPSEAIRLLADIGIFFLMFHAGVETQPAEFFDALKRSLGVAVVGAIVPFGVSFGVATAFGLDPVGAVFVGLTMTATAVVITLKTLKDLGLSDTRVARVIVATMNIAVTLAKVVAFFGLAVLLGRFAYPHFTLPFRKEGGKGFTFVLVVAIAAGLFAEAIGLHMILGAYLAGLFFEEKVAHPNLVRVVADRSYGIAYSFLGPIFFRSVQSGHRGLLRRPCRVVDVLPATFCAGRRLAFSASLHGALDELLARTDLLQRLAPTVARGLLHSITLSCRRPLAPRVGLVPFHQTDRVATRSP